MKCGLSDAQIQEIRIVLEKYEDIQEALVFGSRAMGNFKEASDVDIVLKGNIDTWTASSVKFDLEEETYLPFFFDVVGYPFIDNPQLKEHIDRLAVPFYHADGKNEDRKQGHENKLS